MIQCIPPSQTPYPTPQPNKEFPIFNKNNPPRGNELRINHRIRAREVLVIDPEGKSLGVMPPQDALTKAKAFQLDLVEISPKAKPSVCKIIDFGKYKYDIAKKERDSKKNNVASKLKELKFHINIDAHDYGIKMKHAEQFMFKGMKVKILLRFRGREMQHQDLGMELVKRIIADLAHVGNADYEPKLVGRNINLMLSPLPLKKRVREYTQENEQVEEIEDEQDDQDNWNVRSPTGLFELGGLTL